MLGEPTTIGAYRVLRKLGEGGMGTVYLAEHALLGRRAAIKVLLPALSANQEIVQRFFNEARAVTQIADAGIVQVFDFGVHADGSAFIVMELLEGEPVDQRLARIGRCSTIEALRLVKMIGRSLAAAHAKGIVHRDLKPENLFIVGDPAVTGGERPKILDFGIAKLSRDEPGALKTRTGMVMGTPVYMSPEQCRGAGDVDHRSDIYSIGCVLVTMITGRPPFAGEASGDLIVAHLREPAPLISSRIPGTPEVVDQLVQRCLAKAPAERFASMTELVAAIDAVEAVLYRAGLDAAASGALSASPPPRFSTGVAARTPTTTLGAATGHALAPRPARSRAALAAIVALAIVAAAGITGGIGYVATREGAPPTGAAPSPPQAAAASPTTAAAAPTTAAAAPTTAAASPQAAAASPQAATASPQAAAASPQAAAASPTTAAAPQAPDAAPTPAGGSPAGTQLDAPAPGPAIAAPARKVTRSQRKPSPGRATNHASTTEPVAATPVDRGD